MGVLTYIPGDYFLIAGNSIGTSEEVNKFILSHKETVKVVVLPPALTGPSIIGENGYKVISGWGRLQGFSTGYANSSDLTDDNFVYLQSLKELRSLQLGGAALTDNGYKMFEVFPKLKKISLTFSAITNRGLKNIAELKNLQNSLEELHLHGAKSKLTLLGIKELNKLRNLKLLKVSYCNRVSEKDLTKIQQALPGVEIQIINRK